MSMLSGNGWPVSPNPEDLDIVPLEVGGVQFSPGVRSGKVYDLLNYVASAVHKRVQRANSTYGCWGYSFRENVNSPGEWSNHASGTAIDFNATRNANGVPTAEVWTAAQIAEIHKILDEVGNVVRWGGDYESIPDSMHFEINVPPDQLDVAIPDVPKQSTVWPVGTVWDWGTQGPDGKYQYENMPELTTMSVSYPTEMKWIAEMGSDTAWWVFRPTQSGRLSFDALLSKYTDPSYWSVEGPEVRLYLYELAGEYGTDFVYVEDSWSFPGGFGIPARNQGRFVRDVVAGRTYAIGAWMPNMSGADHPYVRAVVRIGDYATDGPWQDAPPQTRQYLRVVNGVPMFTPPDTGNLNAGLGNGGGFRGGDLTIYRSFAMPYTNPGTDPDARECAWKYARRVWADTGVTWWDEDNDGVWEGGPGSCPVYTLVDMPSSGSALGQVGYEFHIDNGLAANDMTWYVWASSFTFSQQSVINYEENQLYAVWPPPWWPTDLAENEWIETEPGDLELVSMDVRWAPTLSSQPDDDGLIVKWYMGLVEGWDADSGGGSLPHPPGKWGPWYGAGWFGQGPGGDSPESWAASQTHLGDSSGIDIGTWQAIPDEWLEPQGPYDLYPPIRLTVLPEGIFSDAPPPINATISDGIETHYKNIKRGLTLEFRVTIRPPRFRVHTDPGIEDIEWAGVGAISIQPADAGQAFYDKGRAPLRNQPAVPIS